MFLISALVSCSVLLVSSAFVRADYAGLMQQLKDARGMELGAGLSLHLDSVNAPNASLFERHALRFDYEGMGVRVGKALHKDGLTVGFYQGDLSEGRGRKKMGEMLLPALVGFKGASIVTMTMFAIGMLVLKSLAIAKMALVSAAIILMMKVFGGKQQGEMHNMHPVELDHNPSEMHPVYAEYPGDISELAGYQPTAGGNYVAYEEPGAESGHEIASASATSSQYALLETPASNSSELASNTNTIQRRRETHRRRAQPVSSYITVKRRTVSN